MVNKLRSKMINNEGKEYPRKKRLWTFTQHSKDWFKVILSALVSIMVLHFNSWLIQIIQTWFPGSTKFWYICLVIVGLWIFIFLLLSLVLDKLMNFLYLHVFKSEYAYGLIQSLFNLIIIFFLYMTIFSLFKNTLSDNQVIFIQSLIQLTSVIFGLYLYIIIIYNVFNKSKGINDIFHDNNLKISVNDFSINELKKVLQSDTSNKNDDSIDDSIVTNFYLSSGYVKQQSIWINLSYKVKSFFTKKHNRQLRFNDTKLFKSINPNNLHEIRSYVIEGINCEDIYIPNMHALYEQENASRCVIFSNVPSVDLDTNKEFSVVYKRKDKNRLSSRVIESVDNGYHIFYKTKLNILLRLRTWLPRNTVAKKVDIKEFLVAYFDLLLKQHFNNYGYGDIMNKIDKKHDLSLLWEAPHGIGKTTFLKR